MGKVASLREIGAITRLRFARLRLFRPTTCGVYCTGVHLANPLPSARPVGCMDPQVQGRTARVAQPNIEFERFVGRLHRPLHRLCEIAIGPNLTQFWEILHSQEATHWEMIFTPNLVVNLTFIR